MPIQIIRNDITKMHVDAIVNTSNKYLRGGSGVNGAIHKVAGPLMAAACQKLGGCEIGETKITHGYDLPYRYVIHTATRCGMVQPRRKSSALPATAMRWLLPFSITAPVLFEQRK